jgi:NADPH-dependent curcumin reductase CurA
MMAPSRVSFRGHPVTGSEQVVLIRRPDGALRPDDFRHEKVDLPPIGPGQFLVRNQYFSLDAGFRKWMSAGTSDSYLQEMPLGKAVQSIVLGQVVESLNPLYATGAWIMGRAGWERYSIVDGSDLMTILEVDAALPIYEYLAALGTAGLTAYFGLLKVGLPKRGDVLLVSAAGGGVGSLVGQLGKLMGCTTIGISSTEEKCQWLMDDLHYDHAVNYRLDAPVARQLRELAPEGVDIVFDNVGGDLLDQALECLAMNARIVLCGAVSQYERTGAHAGITHLWELVTKRARAEGFMFSDYVDEFPEAIGKLSHWIKEGTLRSPVEITSGIENTAEAFCRMMAGKTRGKCLVKV